MANLPGGGVAPGAVPGPRGGRLPCLALAIMGLTAGFLAVVTGLILNAQSGLSAHNRDLTGGGGDPFELPARLERDEATNNYRRSFNALFVVMQAGLVFETYRAVRSRSALHFYLLAPYHVYGGVHALQEHALWRFMGGGDDGSGSGGGERDSPAWMETAVAVGATTAAVEWAFFAVVFNRLWGWSRLRRFAEAPKTRRMFWMHHAHSKLLWISPFLLLGYLNRLLIQMPSPDGDTGLKVDFLRLLLGLVGLSAFVCLPAYAGLQKESRPLTWTSIVITGVFLAVSVVYYVIGLSRELTPPPRNPWGYPELHAVTITFFVLGVLALPALLALAVANMICYDRGLKELRASQALLGDDEDRDSSSTDVEVGVGSSAEPIKHAAAEPTLHCYPPPPIQKSLFSRTLRGHREGFR